ncbi:hypothetical protein TSOC_012921 [Tetrabaena socialis]|uniref:NAD(P)-binding domain-containing protein n=1 Tax=Tetrabaena socialis TaxID=47790 RepID=A0A2J7ZLR3_9CHLO|nr:hypothetical protein TSOC_012921 [Tetrabaena socialis]|eukprot:PNH01209.1 hypothetical protein TSOC_012921 [Tetrabaena socialis]
MQTCRLGTASRSARVQPFVATSGNVRRSRPLTMRAKAVTYDLDPDNASILVCGGGGVALQVTRKLKDMGSWVWMMQRTDVRKAEIEKMMAFVPKGDALNKEDVQRVYDGERRTNPHAAGAAGKLKYVIIRPGGLVSEPATGAAILTEDAAAAGMIAREDVAALVIKALLSNKADNKVLSAIDPSKTPGPERVPFTI